MNKQQSELLMAVESGACAIADKTRTAYAVFTKDGRTGVEVAVDDTWIKDIDLGPMQSKSSPAQISRDMAKTGLCSAAYNHLMVHGYYIELS